MKKNTNKLAGLAPRQQRREEAKANGVAFEPVYNGAKPERVQHKAVYKAQVNEAKRKSRAK
ncbi:hypothetical protein [Paenibacillus cremeus]|uniref:Uncharacterized protein n=1 Tax=Paenibacillus cremeus TaxID=2163881 RepID=A0A559KCJ0_9BACL|nr:hypothetical protein [Paenibacillus cremeus]TVY09841.1 hypothetical protein FPZ49_10735 [Paenibacillus cremeus]